jgi:hypothetical protein
MNKEETSNLTDLLEVDDEIAVRDVQPAVGRTLLGSHGVSRNQEFLKLLQSVLEDRVDDALVSALGPHAAAAARAVPRLELVDLLQQKLVHLFQLVRVRDDLVHPVGELGRAGQVPVGLVRSLDGRLAGLSAQRQGTAR